MGDFAKIGGILAAPFTGGASLYLTAAAEMYGQHKAASAQQTQLKIQQRQEETAATDREVQRQRRLNAILGSQAAEAAANGVALSGSVANLSLVDAKRAAEDSLVDRVNTGSRLTALRKESRAVRQQAFIASAGTLMGTGRKIANRG